MMVMVMMVTTLMMVMMVVVTTMTTMMTMLAMLAMLMMQVPHANERTLLGDAAPRHRAAAARRREQQRTRGAHLVSLLSRGEAQCLVKSCHCIRIDPVSSPLQSNGPDFIHEPNFDAVVTPLACPALRARGRAARLRLAAMAAGSGQWGVPKGHANGPQSAREEEEQQQQQEEEEEGGEQAEAELLRSLHYGQHLARKVYSNFEAPAADAETAR